MGNKKESSKVVLLKEERTGRNEEEMTAKIEWRKEKSRSRKRICS